MIFDERYVPLLHQANLLVIIDIVCRGMSVFNFTTITAMVDRWRSETRSFHLPCGEMTVTLEDVAMILGLPIRGCSVTGCVEPASWRERLVVFVGRETPVKVVGVKGREAEVHVMWLCEEFRECPSDADKATVTLYVKA
jgi:hypothetical protein